MIWVMSIVLKIMLKIWKGSWRALSLININLVILLPIQWGVPSPRYLQSRSQYHFDTFAAIAPMYGIRFHHSYALCQNNYLDLLSQ